MLATPPGFRPQHIEATIKAGKHLFAEKPVAVDGTGIRKVLAAYDEANKKGLSVVTGTQRRHQAGYVECLKRIHDGAIGDLVGGAGLLEPGRHLGAHAQAGLERHRVPDPQLVSLPLALRRPHRRAARP